jgi:hypothetical protein
MNVPRLTESDRALWFDRFGCTCASCRDRGRGSGDTADGGADQASGEGRDATAAGEASRAVDPWWTSAGFKSGRNE